MKTTLPEYGRKALDLLRAMQTFVTVASAGSLSAASRRLGQPLTTLSRQLADLENHLGAVLIARTTRSMALTAEGRDFLESSRRAIEEIEAVERRIAGGSGELAGELALTAPVLFGRLHVLPVVAEFLVSHPKVTARFAFADSVVDLVEGGLDCAVRIGALPDSSLIATKVGALKYVTCAAPAYLRRRGAPLAPAELAAHDCVAFSSLPGGVRWTFKSASHGRRSIRIEPRLVVNSVEAAIDAAVAGLGVTRLLSYQAERQLAAKRLKVLLEAFDDATVPVHLVQRPAKHAKLHVRAFVDFASERLRARLAKRSL